MATCLCYNGLVSCFMIQTVVGCPESIMRSTWFQYRCRLGCRIICQMETPSHNA